MLTYESSACIAANRETVWQVVSTVAEWPAWLPTVSKIECLDSEPLQVGSRYRVHQPKLRPTLWIVTEMSPFEKFVWQARSPGLTMTAEHTIVIIAPESCAVVLKFSFAGLLGGIVGRMFRKLSTSYLATEAAAMKLAAESKRQ